MDSIRGRLVVKRSLRKQALADLQKWRKDIEATHPGRWVAKWSEEDHPALKNRVVIELRLERQK